MGHIHEKIDITAEVFVVFENKVLLRKHEKYGIWLGVGGHIELAEDPNEAAVREVKEEVGLSVRVWSAHRASVSNTDTYTELIPPVFLNRHRISPEHEHVTHVYFATSESDVVIPEKETDVWKWCTAEDLEHMKEELSEAVYVYAKTALKELSSEH